MPSAANKARRPRLAVFPLRISDAGAAVSHLAFGVMTEIADVLSRFPSLQVIAPQSSFRLANEPDRLERVARALRAAYVVEGALIVGGDEIEVKLELIDVEKAASCFPKAEVGKTSTISTSRVNSPTRSPAG